jgi:hypothetical protein
MAGNLTGPISHWKRYWRGSGPTDARGPEGASQRLRCMLAALVLSAALFCRPLDWRTTLGSVEAQTAREGFPRYEPEAPATGFPRTSLKY